MDHKHQAIKPKKIETWNEHVKHKIKLNISNLYQLIIPKGKKKEIILSSNQSLGSN